MRRRPWIVGIIPAAVLAPATYAQLPKPEDLSRQLGKLSKTPAAATAAGSGDAKTDAAGIKEALALGTERAVASLGRKDGYFGNAAVKILMPSSLQKVADVARLAGWQQQVDEFILSMNRAAEAAAPLAAKVFGDAIRAMTLDDVRAILTGGDTAATDFFRRKTHDPLYAAFKPVVSKKVDEVGTTRAYKSMMGSYSAVPMAGKQSLDLDHYVTEKALDGLFHMVGEEEKQIRRNPAARTTDLLKSVFGK
ncbi:MAG TPA: DUF4197 domain-containing protein [Rubrivivax sp.]|nr:DUF4197 domain-containing protein [Rubrivivax sp.]